MNSNSFELAEFVIGNVKNRGKNIDRINQFALNGIRNECYRSINLFDDDIKEYVSRTKAIKGFRGKHITDFIVVDFDYEKDPTIAQKEVVKFCLYLQQFFGVDLNILRIYFSGHKGFHVLIPIGAFVKQPEPSTNFCAICKGVVEDLTHNFKYVDFSIYHTTALIRIPNTINDKSGLYKVPLTYNELETLNISEIQQLASSPREIQYEDIIEPYEALSELFTKWLHKPLVKDNVSKKDVMFTDILQGVEQNHRTKSAMKLCGKFIQSRLSEPLALSILKLWNKENIPPFADSELESIVRSAYAGYSDSTLDPRIEDVYDMNRGMESYKAYISDIGHRKVLTGFINTDKMIRGLMPGETMCIQGKTGTFKSAIAQNISQNYAKSSNEPVLFISSEMPIENVIERAVQIEAEISGLEVEKTFEQGEEAVRNIAEILFTKIPNFYCLTKSGLDLNALETWITFAEENIYNKKTGLVVIDYIGLLKAKGVNRYEQVSKIALGLKELAKNLNIPIIFLSQVNKSKTHQQELDINSARDSGSISEASDYVISIWEDADNLSTNPELLNLIVAITKNRKGAKAEFPFIVNRKTLRITEDESAIVSTSDRDYKQAA